MIEIWISIFDGRECNDCHGLHERKEDSQYWDSTGRPRQRYTICVAAGYVCRCELFPVEEDDEELKKLIAERDNLIEEAVGEMFSGLKIDIGKGGRAINLSEFEHVKGMLTLPFSAIEAYEDLIWKWKKTKIGYRTLPEEFYKLVDIEKQTAWLKKELGK